MPDCSEVFGSGYTTQCCCAAPQFKTDNANLTVFIHFRNNVEDQTFALFPKERKTSLMHVSTSM